ncbi:NADH:ubiquinone reductase (Na(+)-transporting) subunit F [Thiohalorhabdus methylotrophus]|uniref:NADH:ubiquinone reductase (Na(+)-transporting) subunit F n=1 Tax=Thiohalorhabdus methylotrophus TaxID=3242694 RepID=A0ABV4TU51_9GAMM
MFGLIKSSKQKQTAQVQPSGQVFQVEPGEKLLDAALRAGLDWPHDCRVGSCGSCKCKLLEGKVKELADFDYTLDEEEMESGMILACSSTLKSDVAVEVQLGSRENLEIGTVAGEIAKTTPLTHDILQVEIALDEPLPPYTAGQYAEISVPGRIEHPRSYSFEKAPEDESPDRVTFQIRHVPKGEFTSWLHGENRNGEKVQVSGPFGNLLADPQKMLTERNDPMICVAGGSGMAPIKALLEHARNLECRRETIFLFGARKQEDLFCQEAMQLLEESWAVTGGFSFIPVLSDEPSDSQWQGARGLVTEKIADLGLNFATADAFLAGPPPMIDAAVETLTCCGVQEDRIFFDKFLDASHTSGR